MAAVGAIDLQAGQGETSSPAEPLRATLRGFAATGG